MDAQIKKQMIEEAKQYASESTGGITINNPKIYSAFRDGQDSGYLIAGKENDLLHYQLGVGANEYGKLKELNAELLELKNSFYMDICRAYNAGKESMNKQHVAHQNGDEGGISLFVSSHEYFVSEFPTFKTNVP